VNVGERLYPLRDYGGRPLAALDHLGAPRLERNRTKIVADYRGHSLCPLLALEQQQRGAGEEREQAIIVDRRKTDPVPICSEGQASPRMGDRPCSRETREGTPARHRSADSCTSGTEDRPIRPPTNPAAPQNQFDRLRTCSTIPDLKSRHKL